MFILSVDWPIPYHTDLCPFYHRNQFHCNIHCYQSFEIVPGVQYDFVGLAHQPRMMQSQRLWAPASCWQLVTCILSKTDLIPIIIQVKWDLTEVLLIL